MHHFSERTCDSRLAFALRKSHQVDSLTLGSYSFFFADAAPRNAQNASAAAIPTGARIPGNVETIATILFAESARPTLAIPMKNNEAYIPIRMTIKTFPNVYRPSQREMVGPSRPPKMPLQKPSITVSSSSLAISYQPIREEMIFTPKVQIRSLRQPIQIFGTQISAPMSFFFFTSCKGIGTSLSLI
ncbi:hypothetical protein OKW34_005606 [Paraburkholderia youngii]